MNIVLLFTVLFSECMLLILLWTIYLWVKFALLGNIAVKNVFGCLLYITFFVLYVIIFIYLWQCKLREIWCFWFGVLKLIQVRCFAMWPQSEQLFWVHVTCVTVDWLLPYFWPDRSLCGSTVKYLNTQVYIIK